MEILKTLFIDVFCLNAIFILFYFQYPMKAGTGQEGG